MDKAKQRTWKKLLRWALAVVCIGYIAWFFYRNWENVNITFRRDNDTNRPRINKKDSRLDREQKSSGEYYYYG